jgi:hypothetical protein
LEHQSSDHEGLTHVDYLPYKTGRSMTLESVLSRLRPRQFAVQTPKNIQSLPKSIWHSRTVRRPWSDSPHNKTGTMQKQYSLVRTADSLALRPGRSVVQKYRTSLKCSHFGPHWMNHGRSAHMSRTVRLSQDLATFQTCF